MEEIKIEEQIEKQIEVDGKLITLQEFQEMQNNPTIRLKEIAPGKFKILERRFG
jgi:hypothetical protein